MNQSPLWNDDWAKLQQSYWENLSKMSENAMGTKPKKSTWESAMDGWWGAISPNTSNDTQNYMEKMLGQAKTLFYMNDVMSKNMSASKDLSEGLEKSFEQFKAFFDSSSEVSNPNFASFMQSPMEQWQKFATGISPNLNMNAFNSDSFNMNAFNTDSFNMNGFNTDSFNMKNDFSKLLDMPSLGYGREDEESKKQLIKAGIEYQKVMMENNQFFADFSQASLSRMKQKIEKLVAAEKSIDSARGMYDLWVEVSEEVYAERVNTPEYAQLNGKLVNSLMKVKQLWDKSVEKQLKTMNITTKSDMNAVQDRLQQSRRDVGQLRRDMELLKSEIEELKTLVANKPEKNETVLSPQAPQVNKTTKKRVVKKKPSGSTTAKKQTQIIK